MAQASSWAAPSWDHGENSNSGRIRTIIRAGLLFLAFFIPVETLIPIRTFRPVETLILLAFAYAVYDRRAILYPRPLLWSFAIGLLGFLIASLFSAYPLHSFVDAGPLEFVTPFAVLYLFLAYAPDRAFMLRAAALFIAGAAVLSLYQTVAIVSGAGPTLFGIPVFGSEFFATKKNIKLMVKSIPIGNSDNFVSLWVILVPLASGLLYVTRPAWPIAIALIVTIYAGFLVYSRSGLLVVGLALIWLWILRATIWRSASPAILAVCLAFIAVNISPGSLDYFSNGVLSFAETVQTEPAAEPPSTTIAAIDNSPDDPGELAVVPPAPAEAAETSDLSGTDRALALRTGLAIGVAHWLTGIGYGVYPIVEPHFTSPHSMLLLRFAESGILGLLSFLILAFYAPVRLVEILWRRQTNIFDLVCLSAVSAFFVKAIAFGAAFAVSSNIVWGFGVAMLLAASLIGAEVGNVKFARAGPPSKASGAEPSPKRGE